MERRGEPTPGIAPTSVIRLQAGTAYEHVFLLDKLLVPEKAGIFELHVGVAGTAIPPASTAVRIKEASSGSESHDAGDWFTRCTSEAALPEERAAAVEHLAYSRVVDAIPYQLELMEKGIMSMQERAASLDYIVKAGNEDSRIMNQVANLLSASRTESGLRSSILYAIKSFGWEKLNQPSRAILDPFKQDIDRATPIVISD